MTVLGGPFGVIHTDPINDDSPNGALGLAVENTLRDWNISKTLNSPSYRASGGRQGTGRVKGFHDWSGSFSQYTLNPKLWPGDSFIFNGYTAPDAYPTMTGTTFSGTARVDEIVLRWNWDNNEIPNCQVNFSGAGPLTQNNGAAQLQDLSVPNPTSICGLKVEFGASLDEEEWLNISNIEWRIRAENPDYRNSSTIDTGDCYVGRLRGPLDFDLDITEDYNKFQSIAGDRTSADNIFGEDDDLRLRIFIDATNFWLIEWARVDGFSNLSIDVENGTVLRQTVNLKMNGFSGGVMGQIVDPSGTPVTRWPYVAA